MRKRLTRRRLVPAIAVVALLAAIVPVVLAADPNQVAPGQRVDVRVLLLSAESTDANFLAWKAQLDREGVPYDAVAIYSGTTKAQSITDGRLADYGADHAKYDAVILANGDLVHAVTNTGGTTSYVSALTDPEWAALAKFEQTFGIRQISDNTAPSPAHGLTIAPGSVQDGQTGQLTATGKAAFPYLKGPVPIPNDDTTVNEVFGTAATPAPGADWQTLVSGAGNTAYLGIYTHPDGREEMVDTLAGNENQSHVQLLRHGMLNWVTRGVFLGFQRNYLEIQVDDLFLPDDFWDPVTHTNDYDPAKAIRMTPGDVAKAVSWSKANGIRLDFAYNGGGSALWQADHPGPDALVDAFSDPATRNAFGWINHTFTHPNIDCSSAQFITKQITDNIAWGQQHNLPIDPAELVTGEHSGFANSRPGNPGTIDPPTVDDAAAAPTAGATLAAGSYVYGITASTPHGDTPVSPAGDAVTVAAGDAVHVTFEPVCNATKYTLYRAPSTATPTWTPVATVARGARDTTDTGTAPVQLTMTDTGATVSAPTPTAANTASLDPYPQNPNLLAGLTGAGVRFSATDASKGYPQDPANVNGAQYPPGATFTEGSGGATVQAVPRYPSNVYYNVGIQSQQLAEYNWIYVLPANGGGCVPIPNVTTCRTAPVTWQQYVDSENTIMFRHLMGNDPRPHFVHQTNLAEWNPALPETDPNQGGIVYPVFGGLLSRYDTTFNRSVAPLVQLTTRQIAATLSQQNAWASTLASGKVTAYLQDGRLHIDNNATTSVDVPVTGTTAGDKYAGQRSGWITLTAGQDQTLTPDDPASAAAPSTSGSARVGETLTATRGSWTGTDPISYRYQWQRCDGNGNGCTNIAGATAGSYAIAAGDEGARLRVVVSAGNWISSVSEAASAPTATVTRATTPPAGGGQGAGNGRGSAGSGPSGGARGQSTQRLSLTGLRMTPRRFRVAHRKPQRGTRLDGSRITFRLNRKATVRLAVQRRTRATRHRKARWITVGVITRRMAKGNVAVQFTGRFHRRPLKPQRYRLTVTATAGQLRSPTRHTTFRVVAP